MLSKERTSQCLNCLLIIYWSNCGLLVNGWLMNLNTPRWRKQSRWLSILVEYSKGRHSWWKPWVCGELRSGHIPRRTFGKSNPNNKPWKQSVYLWVAVVNSCLPLEYHTVFLCASPCAIKFLFFWYSLRSWSPKSHRFDRCGGWAQTWPWSVAWYSWHSSFSLCVWGASFTLQGRRLLLLPRRPFWVSVELSPLHK